MEDVNAQGRNLEEIAAKGLGMESIETEEHMKLMWAGQSNVLVAVRVRPIMKHDIVKRSCVRVLDSKVVVILDPAGGDKADILRANRSREKQYAFDYVFEPGSSQDSVYHHTTKFLIHGVLDGFNATVFAYGQTGSGKTYSMIGTPTEPGIMVRVMADLFVHSASQGKQQGVHYKVSVSFLEVYNENIRDLLGQGGIEEYLDLREVRLSYVYLSVVALSISFPSFTLHPSSLRHSHLITPSLRSLPLSLHILPVPRRTR